ncbi:MAG: DUF6569 family protein [Microcella sp.]|uniref:ARPP-1 family domain-containing protein n=1 Tax=Microcella sp. TaxID=1913979 RepID=UPI003315A392
MHTTIPALHVGHGTHQAGLTLFPVWVDAPRIGSLEWSPQALRVTERAEGAAVATLDARNTADRPLVALEGDLVEGGWQNRMLGRSVVLGAHERRELDAVCIEQGRWGGVADHGARGRRASLVVRFGDERARHGLDGDRQSGVWSRIQRFEQHLGSSETSSFTRHLDRQSIRPPRLIDGQRGVIIGIGGRIMGFELFCSGSGLRSRWAGIVQAAAVDARLTDPVATTAERARTFARAVQGRRLHGGEVGDLEAPGPRWFELTRGDDRVDMVGLGARLAGGDDARGILHLTALDRTHPVLVGA